MGSEMCIRDRYQLTTGKKPYKPRLSDKDVKQLSKTFFLIKKDPSLASKILQEIPKETEWPSSEFTQYTLSRFLEEKGVEVPKHFKSVYSEEYRKLYEEEYAKIRPYLEQAWNLSNSREIQESVRRELLSRIKRSRESKLIAGPKEFAGGFLSGITLGISDLLGFRVQSKRREELEKEISAYELTISPEEVEEYVKRRGEYIEPPSDESLIETAKKQASGLSLSSPEELMQFPQITRMTALKEWGEENPEEQYELVGYDITRIAGELTGTLALNIGLAKAGAKASKVAQKLRAKEEAWKYGEGKKDFLKYFTTKQARRASEFLSKFGPYRVKELNFIKNIESIKDFRHYCKKLRS